jgi:hypothetical protein
MSSACPITSILVTDLPRQFRRDSPRVTWHCVSSTAIIAMLHNRHWLQPSSGGVIGMTHIGRLRAISAIGVLALATIGMQGTAAHATSPTVYVHDTYTRAVTGGWGSADVGGSWVIQDPGIGTWSVNGSVGKVTGTTGQYLVARIAPLVATRAELAMRFTSSAPAASQPKWLFILRSVDLLHEYKARVRVAPNGTVLVGMYKVVGNTFPQIGPEVTLPGFKWSPGTALRIRADVIGTSPTAFRIRVWRAATAEPSTWAIVTSDNEPTMQTAGSWGLVAIASTGAASAKTTFTFDNLLITSV